MLFSETKLILYSRNQVINDELNKLWGLFQK